MPAKKDFINNEMVRRASQLSKLLYERSVVDLPGAKLFKKKIYIEDAAREKEKTRIWYTEGGGKKTSSAILEYGYRIIKGRYLAKMIEIEGMVNDDDTWVIKCIRDASMDSVLEKYYNEDELEQAKEAFEKLSEEQRKDILAQLKNSRPLLKNGDEKTRSPFSEPEELECKYLLLKKTYPPEVCGEIEDILSQYNKGVGSAEKNTYIKLLKYLINLRWNEKPKLKYDYDKIRKKMDATHYGQNRIKDQLVQAVEHAKADKKTRCILLCGPPGTGKTSLFYSLFKAAGLSYSVIPGGGKKDETLLCGTGRVYEKGMPGKIVRDIYRNSFETAILFDEIDKADSVVEAALLDIFNGNFVDAFLETPMNLEKVVFVATANDIEDVSPALLDRMTVLTIEPYSEHEKSYIAEHFVIPECKNKYAIDLEFSREAVKKIVSDFTLRGSIREIDDNFNRVYRAVRESEKKVRKINLRNLHSYVQDIIGTGYADEYIREAGQLKRKFLYHRNRYTDEVRARILHLFEMLDTGDAGDKEYAQKALAYLVNVLPGERVYRAVDADTIQNKLNETHYGMEDAKNQILNFFAGDMLRGERSANILLLDGPAGCGKTTIGRAIAEALELPFVKVSLDGVPDAETLSGFARTYKDADAGMIAKHLMRPLTSHCVMLLDEADKMETQRGNPYSVLHSMLDKGGFYDKYLETHLSLEQTWIIATANDAGKIPKTVLDRMHIIHLGGYSMKEKKEIAQEYVIPKIARQFHVKTDFSPDAVDCLIEDYCPNLGARDVEKKVEVLFCSLARAGELRRHQEMVIEKEMLSSHLGAKPLSSGNFPPKADVPGVARALAVSGNQGSSFPIEVLENQYGKNEVEITGMPKGAALESVTLAMTVVSQQLQRGIPKVHIHFGEGGIHKDGPSAGITIFAALMSYMLGQPLPNAAFTGELDLLGYVYAVGGVEEKIATAEKDGVDIVYIPRNNYRQLLKEGKLEKYHVVDIIPVGHVKELSQRLFQMDEGETCRKEANAHQQHGTYSIGEIRSLQERGERDRYGSEYRYRIPGDTV